MRFTFCSNLNVFVTSRSCPYSTELLHWHWNNHKSTLVQVMQQGIIGIEYHWIGKPPHWFVNVNKQNKEIVVYIFHGDTINTEHRSKCRKDIL